jgi:hypothetical protein
VTLAGIRTSDLRRGVALSAAIAIHAVLVTAFVAGLRARISTSSVEEFISTWIVLPSQPEPPRFRRHAPRPQTPSLALRPILVEPLALLPQVLSPHSVDRRIDWDAEAKRAAERVAAAPRLHEFGRPPADPASEEHPSPAHHAGEGYQDVYGDRVYWVSDNCYMVSENALLASVAALNAPGPIPGALPRTACIGANGPTGDLFKDLRAYRKYHPQ